MFDFPEAFDGLLCDVAGLSYSMLVVSTLLLIYGNTYTAWAFYYWFSSFSVPLPWHAEYTGGYHLLCSSTLAR